MVHPQPNGGSSPSTVIKKLVIGGTSATIAKSLTAPLERVRLIQQTSGETQTFGLIRDIVRQEGVPALWRGNFSAVMRIFPTYALRLTLFDSFKLFNQKDTFSAALLSGCAASLVTTISTYPLDVIRTQMAAKRGVARSSFWDTFTAIRASKGFYKGVGINLIENVPYVGISLGSYDYLKQEFPDVSKLALAVTTSSVATLVCFPLDTLRRFMVMNPELNVGPAYKELAQHGWARFYRGLPVSVLKAGPTVGLILTLNDALKDAFAN